MKSTTEKVTGLRIALAKNMEKPGKRKVFINLSGNSCASATTQAQAIRLADFLEQAVFKVRAWADEVEN